MKQARNFKFEDLSKTVSANYYASSLSVNESDIDSVQVVNDIPENCIYEDKGKYSVFEIANWFLSQNDMTHKKLQKLCYYSQAWYYALFEKRLMSTDFQAWVHGPVSPALYDRFKEFGFDTISLKSNYNSSIDEEDISFLEDIMKTYGDHTGNALEALTHRELPWIEARKGYEPNERCTKAISPQLMRDYYKSISSGD